MPEFWVDAEGRRWVSATTALSHAAIAIELVTDRSEPPDVVCLAGRYKANPDLDESEVVRAVVAGVQSAEPSATVGTIWYRADDSARYELYEVLAYSFILRLNSERPWEGHTGWGGVATE